MGKKDFIGRKDIHGQYMIAIAHALKARPNPPQSKYYVHGALLTSKGRLFTGGNHEYGITRGIHSEETMIAKFLEDRLPKERIEAIAFHNPLMKSESIDYFIPPCGNCRDLIKEYSTNPLIVSGNYEKNLAVAIPFKKLLFEKFNERSLNELSEFEREIMADMIERDNKIIDSHTKKIYTAGIIIGETYFRGQFLGREDYHPTLPIESAINNIQIRDYADIDKIILFISGKQNIPYRDRQALFELSKKVKHEIPIILFSRGKKKENIKISKVWTTNSTEWLPYAFGKNINIKTRFK